MRSATIGDFQVPYGAVVGAMVVVDGERLVGPRSIYRLRHVEHVPAQRVGGHLVLRDSRLTSAIEIGL